MIGDLIMIIGAPNADHKSFSEHLIALNKIQVMEKILVIFPAQKATTPFIDFALYLAKETGSALTGVFIENPYAESIEGSRPSLALFNESQGNESYGAVDTSVSIIEQNIHLFKEH